MLVVETIGRIRREHRIKGKSIKGIARDLKVSRNTVRKVLRSGATSFGIANFIELPDHDLTLLGFHRDRPVLTTKRDQSTHDRR
jgi:hypothetical protein